MKRNSTFSASENRIDASVIRTGEKFQNFSTSRSGGGGTETIQSVYPVFKERNVPVVFSCDDNFLPYFSVALQSLIENSSTDNNYDIVLLYQNIPNSSKNLLLSQVNPYKNISLRFYPIDNIFTLYGVSSWYLGNCQGATAYARLFIPLIFEAYERVVYLDCDILCLTDIAELYAHDIHDKLFGVVKEMSDKDVMRNISYLLNTLKITCIDNYFNSGICIFNISEINKKNIFTEFIKIAYINNHFCRDQNILNAVCQDNILFFDYTWNASVPCLFFPDRTSISNDDVKQILYNAKILHYNSPVRPIDIQDHILAQSWWHYAGKTPFYRQLRYMCASRIRAESERKIAEMEHKLSESERKIIDYEIETARLYKSRSWMITKPLRSMAQILRAL